MKDGDPRAEQEFGVGVRRRSDSATPYESISAVMRLLAQLISLNTWLAWRANLTIQDARWPAAEVL